MAAKGLGRGLDALIPSSADTKPRKNTGNEKESETKGAETIVKITKVEPNRDQPRKNFEDRKSTRLNSSHL